MLSNTSRSLVYLCALLYGILGALLYLFPETLAPVFAWKVTAFTTMTIGGWCLGNAWLAFITASRWEWSLVRTSLLYLWLFGIGELIVLFAFRDRLTLLHPIAWLYLITLFVNVVAAIVGVMDYLRILPPNTLNGTMLTSAQKFPAAAFVVFVGFLGMYGLIAQIGDVGTNGGIFPEVMSLFTLRSFGVFYLSLALGVIPFFWEIGHKTILHHSYAAYGLIVFITIAALAYLPLFDFSARPGGLLYFLAYLAVGVPLIFTFRKYGTGSG